MILDLKEISVNQGAILPFEYQLDMSDVTFFGECPLTLPLVVKGEVSNHAGVLMFNAEAVCDANFACARCNSRFLEKLSFPIFYVLSKSVSENSSDETIEIVDNMLDVDQTVRDFIILNMDMVHICKPDCKGLCQICGQNLNEGCCDCKPDNDDPRWASLKNLLDNKDYQ